MRRHARCGSREDAQYTRSDPKSASVALRPSLVVVVAVAVAATTVSFAVRPRTAAAEPPFCTPTPSPTPVPSPAPGVSLGGDNACIPSPLDCLTGKFNGYFEVREKDGALLLAAKCTAYVDPVTGQGHIVDYSGGSRTGCGAIISESRMLAGVWSDPNRCPPASAPAGYGAPGRAYDRPAVPTDGGVVASVSPEATAVGMAVLDEGGNAIDAAVATTFAVGVTRPEQCGIGGGGFLVYRGADGDVATLDFRETAPEDFGPTTLDVDGLNKEGYGHLLIGVPGTVAGMAEALKRKGTISLARAIGPAQSLAADGISISTDFSDWSHLVVPSASVSIEGTTVRATPPVVNRERLRRFPATAAIYLDELGQPWRPSPISPPLVQADYARSLALIAKYGPEAFYSDRTYAEGPSVGKLIAAEMERSRGAPERTATDPEGKGGQSPMKADDLANYRPVWRKPLTGTYRGAEIIAMPPPTSGGVVTLEVLNLIEGFDVAALGHSSADHLHLLAEANKIAWADRNAYLADPDFLYDYDGDGDSEAVPTRRLTSKSYADSRRNDPNKPLQPGGNAQSYKAGDVFGSEPRASKVEQSSSGHTAHVSVIDRNGNAVSVTCTIGDVFGSFVVAPGTGFLLNSQMDFSPAGTPNEGGPRKRALSSTSPTIVVRDGQPVLVVGAAGGPFIPMSVVNTIVNVLDFGMDTARAVDAARVEERTCCGMLLEELRVPKSERDELARRNHTIHGRGEYGRAVGGTTMAIVQAAGMTPDGKRFAVSDARM